MDRLLSLADVRNLLTKVKKDRELTYEQKATLEHAKRFARLPVKQTHRLVAKLERNGIAERVAYRIADLMPQHPDDVRAIYAKERTTLEPEQIDEIIKTVKGFLGE